MATTTPAKQKELFGQPVGLYILFFTEMWERFSYYGMRAILVLYLVQETTKDNPGLGWTSAEAFALYGWYTMLVYVACIPGGLIADNWLGQKKTVLIGGIILVAGHSILAIEALWAFYSGLALIVIGVGMLKANISTMVGGLYEKGDIRRDKGFTIFYIGINLGALLSALSVGYVGEEIGWHYGFGMAGVAMALGLIVYWWGQKYVANVGNLVERAEGNDDGKTPVKQEASIADLFKALFKTRTQLFISSALMLFSVYWLIFQDIAYGMLFIFLSAVVALILMVYRDLTSKVMKDRFMVIILSFLLVIVFWGAFEQAGGLMNIYAADKTDRMLSFTIPFIDINQVPASWFQALNALFIIIFGVAIANFWARRKLKNKEASSLFKMATGVIIMGLGFLFMAGSAAQYTAGGDKAGMYWLVLAYLLHTIGELCSSPVSLSFVTKLAPLKYASLMMGLYFAATGLGNKMAGVIGEASQSEPIKIELTTGQNQIEPFLNSEDSTFVMKKDFRLQSEIYPKNGEFEAVDAKTGKSLLALIKFENPERKKEVIQSLKENNVTKANPYHANLEFNKKDGEEAAAYKLGYAGSFIIDEEQTHKEFWTFISITIFTSIFGILVILLLKPLKRLTHGVEDEEREMLEQEGYEIADNEHEH